MPACLLISGDADDADRIDEQLDEGQEGDMFMSYTPPIYNFRPKIYSIF